MNNNNNHLNCFYLLIQTNFGSIQMNIMSPNLFDSNDYSFEKLMKIYFLDHMNRMLIKSTLCSYHRKNNKITT